MNISSKLFKKYKFLKKKDIISDSFFKFLDKEENKNIRREFLKDTRNYLKENKKENKKLDYRKAKNIIKKKYLEDYPEIFSYCEKVYKEVLKLKKKQKFIDNLQFPVPRNVKKKLNNHSDNYYSEFEKFKEDKRLQEAIYDTINMSIYNVSNFTLPDTIKFYLKKNKLKIHKKIHLHDIKFTLDLDFENDDVNKRVRILPNIITRYNIEKLKNLINKKKNQIILIPFLLTTFGKTATHSNFVLIDKKCKVIYHYEPHGIYLNDKNKSKLINKSLKNFFRKKLQLNYKFNSFFLNYNLHGIQRRLPLCTFYGIYSAIFFILNSKKTCNYGKLTKLLLNKLNTNKKRDKEIYEFMWYFHKIVFV